MMKTVFVGAAASLGIHPEKPYTRGRGLSPLV